MVQGNLRGQQGHNLAKDQALYVSCTGDVGGELRRLEEHLLAWHTEQHMLAPKLTLAMGYKKSKSSMSSTNAAWILYLRDLQYC